MTAEGHLLFSISLAVFAKNAELTPILAQGDWWHIIPSAILTCLLPDIDHPKSTLGQRLKWISKPIARAFGHRGFTHSLVAVFAGILMLCLQLPAQWMIPPDALQGMVIGYISHIIGDMLTPAGVPLLWPCRWRFRLPLLNTQKGNQLERVLCVVLFGFAVLMPQNIQDSAMVRWSSNAIHSLQGTFSLLVQRYKE